MIGMGEMYHLYHNGGWFRKCDNIFLEVVKEEKTQFPRVLHLKKKKKKYRSHI